MAIDIIEPCGFLFSDAGFRRAGLDSAKGISNPRSALKLHRGGIKWTVFFAAGDSGTIREENIRFTKRTRDLPLYLHGRRNDAEAFNNISLIRV